MIIQSACSRVWWCKIFPVLSVQLQVPKSSLSVSQCSPAGNRHRLFSLWEETTARGWSERRYRNTLNVLLKVFTLFKCLLWNSLCWCLYTTYRHKQTPSEDFYSYSSWGPTHNKPVWFSIFCRCDHKSQTDENVWCDQKRFNNMKHDKF